MGMDVCGVDNPDAYFRNNVWWWRPLADYCCDIAPDVTSHCHYWQSNDGDGLNAGDAIALADRLEVELVAGRTEAYAAIRQAELDRIPDEPCTICGGTGLRAAPPTVGPGDEPCNGCDSKGKRRPFDTYYPFSADNVRKFVEFLRVCGGFEIH